jgi:hypothetical protein
MSCRLLLVLSFVSWSTEAALRFTEPAGRPSSDTTPLYPALLWRSGRLPVSHGEFFGLLFSPMGPSCPAARMPLFFLSGASLFILEEAPLCLKEH